MNARQLEVFRTIMRCGTLTGAARALNVSQPALSQSLLHTEDELGIALFQRVKGRLVPTHEAKLLFPEADRLFRELESLRRFARDLRYGKAGLVRLAASTPPSLSIVPRALAAFRAARPGVQLRSYVVPAAVIAEMLVRREAEIGVAMNDQPTPLLETELVGRSEVVCLMQAEHRLAERSTIGPGDLARETLISYRADSLPALLIERRLSEEGARLRPDVEIDVSITAIAFVRQGIGVALVDGLLPWNEFAGLVTRPFRPSVSLPVCLLTSSERPLSRNHDVLRQHLREAVLGYVADPGHPGVLRTV
jgi:DNA-binding transcriptional LysR family regulator